MTARLCAVQNSGLLFILENAIGLVMIQKNLNPISLVQLFHIHSHIYQSWVLEREISHGN